MNDRIFARRFPGDWTVLFVAGCYVVLIAAAIWIAWISVRPAGAHQTVSGIRYPMLCCSNKDCQPAPAGSVLEHPDGYRIASTGEVVPYTDKRIKEALDTEFHVCQQAGDFDKGRVLCIFPPLRGF